MKPKVWIFTPRETESGYYEVMWAGDGDLNKATRRGAVKKFKLWSRAMAFAKAKARSLGVTLSSRIHR